MPAAPTLASSTRLVASDRVLLASAVACVISGLAASATAPNLTLFLTQDLHASLRLAGWFYLTNVTAPLAGFAIGSLSDRSGRRWVWYRLCCLIAALGWFTIALARHVWVPFVASALLLAFVGAAGGQLFAGVRDHLGRLERDGRIGPGAATQALALVRMAMTAGWIVGPMIGSWAGSVWGLRVVLAGSGVGVLAQAAVLVTQRDEPRAGPPPMTASAPATTVRDGSVPLMLLFTALCVLTLSGNTMKYAYLPIYMEQTLGLSGTMRGAVIGSQQVIELSLMPVCAIAATRWGSMRVVAAGAATAALAHLCFVAGHTAGWLFVGQALLGVMWSAIAALGLPVAMELAGTRVGLASGVFMSGSSLASAIGGLVGGAAVAWLGLPGIFWLPAVVSAGTAVGLLLFVRLGSSA